MGKVYAPTLYNVLLSPEDDENLGGFADTLAGELETYLVGYARERSYVLAARPVVRFIVDPDLKLGRFDVIGELLSPEELAAELDEEFYDEDETPPASSRGREAPSIVGSGGARPAGEGARCASRRSRSSSRASSSMPRPRTPTTSGAPAPGIATVTVRGVDHDVVLRGDRMVVGRLSSCDVCLQDKNTSRQHAAFVRDGAGWAVEDLGSTNGTLVNGKAGRPHDPARRRRHRRRHHRAHLPRAEGLSHAMIDVALLAGRLLLLALLYLFLFAAVRTGIGLVAGQRAKGRAAWTLSVVQGPRELRGVSVPVTGPVVIGRSPGADIVIGDDFVTGSHARVSPSGDGAVLEDLGSTNGTVLNGARVTAPQMLRAGDAIDIGAVRLKVERS